MRGGQGDSDELPFCDEGWRMIERRLMAPLCALGPWLLALAPAYLAWSALASLAWPIWLCWTVAGAVEVFGTTATMTALELRDYNARKRQADPHAPERTAWLIAGVYIVAISVFCLLHAMPGAATYAVALWPVMAPRP